MKTLCIDLGGSSVKLAAVEEGIVCEMDVFSMENQSRMKDVLKKIQGRAEALCSRQGGIHRISGIGFGFPGIVDPDKKHVVVSNGKYPDAADTDYEKWADECFGLPIFLQNDAASALAGELAYGVGKGEKDAVMMILGTGVGTAASRNGRVLCGRHGTMGILGGHMAIGLEHPRMCSCGNLGCLEAYAGTWALEGLAREEAEFGESLLARQPRIDYRALWEGCQMKDPVSLHVFSRVRTALEMGAVNLVHAYDPELLILSGGPSRIEPLCSAIEEYVHAHAWTPWGRVRVAVAENPEASVVLGLHELVCGSCQ